MSIRFFLILLFYFFLMELSFSRDPYTKTIHRFEKNDPVLSSAMRAFVPDVTGDAMREIVLQNNYKFSVYRLDSGKESLVFFERFTLSPVALGSGPHYFCFGRMEPDEKETLLILTPHALFKRRFDVPGEDGAGALEKIMEYESRYPPDDKSTRISFTQFAIDVDGDGFEELFLPKTDGFSLYKISLKDVREIPIPPVTERLNVRFRADASYFDYWRSDSEIINLTDTGDGKKKALVSRPAGAEKNDDKTIRIYKPLSPLSFSKEPDQEMTIRNKPIFKSEPFTLVTDFDRDGLMDVMIGESNFDIFSPLTILKFYNGRSGKTGVMEKPERQIRLRDYNGAFFFDDFTGNGFTDFCLLQFDYNPSSTDDVVAFYLNDDVRYRLDFHDYSPDSGGYSSVANVSFPIRVRQSSSPYGRAGASISLKGDFNGDGMKDIMALVSPKRGEIYTRNPMGFNKKPYAAFNAYDSSIFCVKDMDGGGVDDLVLISMKENILCLYLFR